MQTRGERARARAAAQAALPRHVALLRAVRRAGRGRRAGGDRAGRPRHVRRRGLRQHRWSACSAPARCTTAATGRRRPRKPAAPARPHHDLPADRGHVHPDRAARDGRHRAGRRRSPRSGWSPRPGSCSSGCRSPRRAGYVTTVYMCLGLDRRVRVRPAVRVDRAGRACCSSPAAASATRSAPSCTRPGKPDPVARDLRLPRDLPRVRDPRRAACTTARSPSSCSRSTERR